MRRAGAALAARTALAAGAALAVLAAGAGCREKKKRPPRSKDTPAVELVSAAALADGGIGKPGDGAEREPNDGADVATALPPGSAARGRIEPDTDVDYYRIEVAERGGLSVALGPVPGVDLTLELEDASGAPLAKSDRGAANVAEGVPNLGVTPGRYTAIVRKRPAPTKKGKSSKKAAAPEPAVGAAPEYELRAQVAPFAKGAEREPDDDRGTANDLIVTDTVTGHIGWAGDADFWKLSVEALTAKTVVDLEVTPVEGVALTLEIADGVGQPLAVRKAPKGAAVALRNLLPVVAAGAAPYYYVIVRGDRSNPEAAYQLKVAARPVGNDPEHEPNDAPDKAMAFPADRTVIDEASWTPGDVDCYAIPPEPNAWTVDVVVETPDGADLRLELYVNGKSIQTADAKGKGAQEKISGPVPAGGRAVVCLRGTEASQEGTYSLRFVEGRPGKGS